MAEDLPYCSTDLDAVKAADETVSRRLDPAPQLEVKDAPPRTPVFEVRRDALEATRNGMFGGPADDHQVTVPGLLRCFIDGVAVSLEEFKRRYEESHGVRLDIP